MEKFYFKIFNHYWMPIFIQSRIAFLKIPVHLQTLADFVQSRNKMLEKPTLEALKEVESSSELKPTPILPSTAKASKDQSLVNLNKECKTLTKSRDVEREIFPGNDIFTIPLILKGLFLLIPTFFLMLVYQGEAKFSLTVRKDFLNISTSLTFHKNILNFR